CAPPCFSLSSRRRHTRFSRDWSSDVCSSDLGGPGEVPAALAAAGTGGDRGARAEGAGMTVLEWVYAATFTMLGVGVLFALHRLRSEERRGGEEAGQRWEAGHRRQKESVRRYM